MEKITQYFPQLSDTQTRQLAQLEPLYREWNDKINVISRKDMENFYTNHVLHSLAIAHLIRFAPATQILDIGTGGGFPGIPLAILNPEADFLLVDSIGKKIKVVQEVAQALGLQNVQARQQRAEQIPMQFDFIVSRAVTALPAFMSWVQGKIRAKSQNNLPNGVLYLKGGDFMEELQAISYAHTLYDIAEFFTEPFFETKKIVHIYKP